MPRLALALLACVPLLVACGEEQEPPPAVFEVRAPRGEVRTEFRRVGVAFERPRNWTLRRRRSPSVFELVSGEAVVAGWAYRREEPLPETDAQLDSARKRLLAAIEERDPAFRVRSSVTTEIAGAPAIEVRGDQVISKRPLRTRSVHVFEGGIEYVIEAIAPPADHLLVDGRVLEPLLRSLRLDGEAADDGSSGDGSE